MPYLEIKLGPDTMLLRFAGRIDYVVGRLPRSDVQVRDMKVSRLHTQLFIDSRGFAWARDLGSSVGTFVNNQKVRPKGFAPLLDGTQLRIGDAKVTFHEEDPPPDAVDPPSASNPRGLIRTNTRKRHFTADVTVLALDQPAPAGEGPAEPPPEVKLDDFTGEPTDQTSRQPDAPKKRRDSGIVEAPWDKHGSGRLKAVGKKATVRVPQRPGTQAGSVMPSAEIDENGNFLPPKSAPQAAQHAGPVKRVPPIPVPGQTPAPPSANFRPPPPIQGEMPIDEDSTRAPKLPTVRLDRSAVEERLRMQEEEVLPSIPAVSVGARDEVVEEEPPVEPRIGMPPGTTPDDILNENEFEEDVEIPDEDDLTGEHAIEQIGGKQDFGDINFGDGGHEEVADEAVFGAASAKIEGDDRIDIEVTPPPGSHAAQPPRGAGPPRVESGTYNRDGATADRTFKPRKTRKLMKRRTGTLEKTTDKTFDSDIPEPGAKTVFVPRPDHAMLSRGADDEGEDETSQADRLDENIEAKTLDDLGEGPGGDTVALPGRMMNDLRADLSTEASRGRPQVGARPTDLLADLDSLPKGKKAATSDDPDTLVE